MNQLFKKLVVMFSLVAMASPSFASTPDLESSDPNQDSAELALERGLTPDEFLESSDDIDYEIDYVDENADSGMVSDSDSLYQRRPGPPGRGPGRPGPGRPGPGRPGPRPPRRPQPPPRAWHCEARDRAGYIYQARDWNRDRARWEAVRTCERRTRAGGCRLLGCR